MSWALVYFGKVLNHLGRYSKGWAILTAFIAFITGGIPALVSLVMQQIGQLIASLAIDELGNVSFAGLEYISFVNAVFPLSEFVVLMGIYCTAWVTVIVIRWAKSFVPTMAN